MYKLTFAIYSTLLVCSTSYADNCEDIRTGIASKIKSAGVASYTVTVVDAAANAPGKLVGTCAQGAKKIMYAQQVQSTPAATTPVATNTARPALAPAPAASAAKPKASAKRPSDGVLTECKDGSVSVGGDCKK